MSLYVNGLWVTNSPDLELQFGDNVTATAVHETSMDRGRVRLIGSSGGQAQVVYGSTAGTACEGNDARLSDARTPISHSHAQSDITSLTSDLASKSSIGHTHTKSNITDFAHTHAESEITNLVADLSGKAASTHSHTATDIDQSSLNISQMQGVLSTLHGGTSANQVGQAFDNLAPTTAQGDLIVRSNTNSNARLPAGSNGQVLTADSTQSLGLKWASSSSDPWVYSKVSGSDFTTTSSTAVDVTGLAFTPSANTSYEFEAVLMLRTATTTVNPRAGLAWPTGMTDGVAQITESQAAAGTGLFAAGNPNASLLIAVGGLPNTNQSWPATIKGMIISGSSPSGQVRVQLASETAGTTVRVVIGSFLRWRAI